MSSILEDSIRIAAMDMVDLVVDFFPDEDGKVRAVEYVDSSSGYVR